MTNSIGQGIDYGAKMMLIHFYPQTIYKITHLNLQDIQPVNICTSYKVREIHCSILGTIQQKLLAFQGNLRVPPKCL
jgi:hypothetical protein